MQKFATGRDNLNHFVKKKLGETMVNYQSQIVKGNNSLNECSFKSTKYQLLSI